MAATLPSVATFIPCAGSFAETLAFFADELGFHVARIYPADDPRVADLVRGGARLRLDSAANAAPGELLLAVPEGEELPAPRTAPNGTVVRFEPALAPVRLPPLCTSQVLTRAGEAAAWVTGRAGMRYRDLIPDRQGGRFIASHIRIEAGGAVPDWVHYHRVRFQMIFCRRGWVRVVYEDQGEPFVMHAGDCVLQPPGIRHRVLESSAGLEVVEIGCPAEHETLADPALPLPNDHVDPTRDFDGQRFVRHVAAEAMPEPVADTGFERVDTRIAAATDGLADVAVLAASGSARLERVQEAELCFLYMLDGRADVGIDGAEPITLAVDDSLTIPRGSGYGVAPTDATDLSLLVVTVGSP